MSSRVDRPRLIADFGYFITELWKNRRLDRKAPLSDIEIDIAYYIAANGPHANAPRFRGVLAPRGLGKTHIAAALASWRLIRDPERKVLIPSKSETHAKMVVGLVREWIRHVHFLHHLSPGPNHLDASNYFDVGQSPEDSAQPSVKAIGTDGQLEGNRAHTILPDDVETKNNTLTLESRLALDERVKEFKVILYPNIPHARGGPVDPPEIVYIGTYHHEESVYAKLGDRGYKFLTYPLVYPSPGEKYLNLAPIIVRKLDEGAKPDDSVFPLRFDSAEIASRRAEGRRHFNMQNKLLANQAAQDLYPLKLSDLIVFPCHRDIAPMTIAWGTTNDSGRNTAIEDIPCHGFSGDRLYGPIKFSKEWAPYARTVQWIDPAGRGRDWTGTWVVSQLGPYFWLKGRLGLPGGSSEADMLKLAEFGRKHGARDIYIESNADTLDTYRPMYEARLRQLFLEPGDDPTYPEGYRAAVIDDTKVTHSTRQKEIRIIDTIEPVTSGHRVIIDPSCLETHDGEDQEHTFQFQYSRMTRDRGCLREDGCIDALEGCLRALAYTLRVDPEQARKREQDRQIDEQIRAMRKLTGLHAPEPRMFTHRR